MGHSREGVAKPDPIFQMREISLRSSMEPVLRGALQVFCANTFYPLRNLQRSRLPRERKLFSPNGVQPEIISTFLYSPKFF